MLFSLTQGMPGVSKKEIGNDQHTSPLSASLSIISVIYKIELLARTPSHKEQGRRLVFNRSQSSFAESSPKSPAENASSAESKQA